MRASHISLNQKISSSGTVIQSAGVASPSIGANSITATFSQGTTSGSSIIAVSTYSQARMSSVTTGAGTALTSRVNNGGFVYIFDLLSSPAGTTQVISNATIAVQQTLIIMEVTGVASYTTSSFTLSSSGTSGTSGPISANQTNNFLVPAILYAVASATSSEFSSASAGYTILPSQISGSNGEWAGYSVQPAGSYSCFWNFTTSANLYPIMASYAI